MRSLVTLKILTGSTCVDERRRKRVPLPYRHRTVYISNGSPRPALHERRPAHIRHNCRADPRLGTSRIASCTDRVQVRRIIIILVAEVVVYNKPTLDCSLFHTIVRYGSFHSWRVQCQYHSVSKNDIGDGSGRGQDRPKRGRRRTNDISDDCRASGVVDVHEQGNV
ncbi:hypothetical protein QTP88_022536 [Uroleucon formosanum]